jgi:pseudouridine synthase
MLHTVVVRAGFKGEALASPSRRQLVHNSVVSPRRADVVIAGRVGTVLATSNPVFGLPYDRLPAALLLIPGLLTNIISIKVAAGFVVASLFWGAAFPDLRTWLKRCFSPRPKRNQYFEWVVEISHAGIQVYNPFVSPTRVPTPSVFIPLNVVLDCIVYEVIQIACVRSVVSLRVRHNDSDQKSALKTRSWASQVAGVREVQLPPPDYRLIPLFQGVQLTYRECMEIRSEIQQRLEYVSLCSSIGTMRRRRRRAKKVDATLLVLLSVSIASICPAGTFCPYLAVSRTRSKTGRQLCAKTRRRRDEQSGRTAPNLPCQSKKQPLQNRRGRLIGHDEKTVVLLYHKPKDLVCTHSAYDELDRMNVYNDVISMKRFIPRVGETPLKQQAKSPEPCPSYFTLVTGISSKLHSIGRLDAATSGLLLLTNDGGLVHHVTNSAARSHDLANGMTTPIFKTYHALIMGSHHDNHVHAYLPNQASSASSVPSIVSKIRMEGVDIGAKYGGHTLPPLDIHVVSYPTATTTLVSLTLSEGKNRQIRRMFHALGSGVIRLQRMAIGRMEKSVGKQTLTLESVPSPGDWRILTDDEVYQYLNWRPRLLSNNC